MQDEAITVRFHRSMWDKIPYEVQVYIGQLFGPLYPDKDGVLTMETTAFRWAEIQEMMKRIEARP